MKGTTTLLDINVDHLQIASVKVYVDTVQPRNVRTGNVPLRVTVRFFYSYKT